MNKHIEWKKVCPIIVIVLFLSWLTIDRVNYLLTATANVPIMDYWRYIVLFVEKIFNEGVSLIDLWEVQEGTTHRHFGIANILFLLNVKLFGLNTQVEIVLGAICMFINCCFLLWLFLKKIDWNNAYIKGGFVLLAICMFNINQWEILTLEFSMGFTLRILMILWTVNYFDTIQFKEKNKFSFGAYLLYLILVACLCGSYAPALLGTFVFVVLVKIFLKKETKRTLIQNLLIVLFFSTGCVLIFWGTSSGAGDSSIGIFMEYLIDGTLFKAIFLMLGSSIMHVESPLVSTYSELLVNLGAIVFVIYMIAIVIYFYRKMYEKTYVPIMLMAYTAGNILVISFGRIPMFGVGYVVSSRYVCETTLGLVGVCWIFLYEFQAIINKLNALAVVRVCALYTGLFIIFISLGYSDFVEKGIAPYRKMYSESLIQLMMSGEEITDENSGGFQADTELVKEGIEIMKQYKLGVFGE